MLLNDNGVRGEPQLVGNFSHSLKNSLSSFSCIYTTTQKIDSTLIQWKLQREERLFTRKNEKKLLNAIIPFKHINLHFKIRYILSVCNELCHPKCGVMQSFKSLSTFHKFMYIFEKESVQSL